MNRRWTGPAVAACAWLIAWSMRGSIAGGVAWMIAVAIACGGVGIGLERTTGQRVSDALTMTSGLAALLVVSTGAALLGWFTAPVLIAAVIAGTALTALPRRPAAVSIAPKGERPGTGFALRVAGGGALIVMGVSVMAPGTVIEDGWNRVFAVKQLWDVGTLAGGWHESGLQVVGQAYAALTTGAELGCMFGAGLCAALVIFVVASDLSGRTRSYANLMLAFVVIAIVVRPVSNEEWLATLLQLSAILALRTARPGRTTWHTIVSAIALGLVRDEYWLLAAPYMFAGVALPRMGRPPRIWIVLAIWLVTSYVVLLALGVRPGPAIIRAIPLLAAWPLALLMLRLLGTVGWRTPLGAMCGALASYQLGLATYAIAPSVHVAEATFAAWLAFGLTLVMSSDLISRPRAEPYVRWGTASASLAVLISLTLIYPSVKPAGSGRVVWRFTSAIIAWRRHIGGADRWAEDVRAAQLRVPAGARVAFWGRSAADLDFQRNPIRDLWGDNGELTPVVAANLRDIDWLIVEDIAMRGAYDPWLGKYALASPTQRVTRRVTLEDSFGVAHLYRVR